MGAGEDPAPIPPGGSGPAFDVRRVVVAPGDSHVHDGDEWRGAIVLLERGRIELVCSDGDHRVFLRGDVLWLDGLTVRALRNPGREPAVLLAISRR
ncbi:cupin domain-containing protein [Streptosporangium sp. NPDC049046]|uniref:cupin domain-containing protein n=1 Tax=Streptosporangium sp. NPDC049046 TaxID=3155031 RepID=UPI00342B0B6B